MRLTSTILICSLACCHIQSTPIDPPQPVADHTTNEELVDAARTLADVCLGVMDKSAPEVAQIFDLLKKCIDKGIPEAEEPASCGHFACNRIRMGKLLDICPPREMHPQWTWETKL